MYDYKIERKKIFTEEGQKTFLKIRDNVKELLKEIKDLQYKAFVGVENE